jgi:outer membrane usher protein
LSRKRWRSLQIKAALSARISAVPTLVAVLVCTLVCVSYLPAQEGGDDPADLFSEVFGSPPPEEEVTLSVSVNGIAGWEVPAVTDFSVVRISSGEFLAILEEWLVEGAYAEVTAALSEDFFQPEAAEVLDMVVFSDLTRLHLEVDIPGSIMKPQPFGRGRRLAPTAPMEPENISGFVNLSSRVSAREERSVLTGTVEPSLWVYSTVFTGEIMLYRPFDGEYREGEEVITFQSYRAFRDIRSLQLRASAGTVISDPPGPFSAPSLLGVDLDRTITMNQRDRLLGQRRYDFSVPEDGLYRINVNDRVVASERVRRGSYTIEDMRLQSGLNRLTIEPGVNELIAWSPRLVTEGKHVYRGTAGVYRDDLARPAASAYWLWGFRPEVTLGSVFQIDDTGGAFGATGRTATRAGITELALGMSFPDSVGTAVSLDHSVALPLYPRFPSISMGVEYYDPNYRLLEDDDDVPASRTQLMVNGSVGHELEQGPRLSLSARWRRLYSGADRTALAFSVNQAIGTSGSFSFRIGPEWQDGTVRWSGGIFLRVYPGSGQVATAVNYNLTNGPASVSFYPQSTPGITRFNWNAQVTGFDRSTGASENATARLGYQAYRWRAAAAPGMSYDVETGDTEVYSTFEGATALVFAGRSVSISSPVRGAFAIFVPRETVQGYRIGVQPVGDDYRAVIDRLAGVIPDLRSYRSNVVTLDGTSLPDGLSLGGASYQFDPLQNAGYRIVVGSEATVYVTGILVDQLNRNPGLAFGLARGENEDEVMFFSDESGYFEIHDLRPGRYTLFVDADREYSAEIVIPPDTVGQLDLGPVVIQERQEGEE